LSALHIASRKKIILPHAFHGTTKPARVSVLTLKSQIPRDEAIPCHASPVGDRLARNFSGTAHQVQGA